MSKVLNKLSTYLGHLAPIPTNMPAGSIGIINSNNKVIILSGYHSLNKNDLQQSGVSFPIRDIYIAPQTTLTLSINPKTNSNLVITNGMAYKNNQPQLVSALIRTKGKSQSNYYSYLRNLTNIIINIAPINSSYIIEPFIVDAPFLSITNLLIIIMIIVLIIYACKQQQSSSNILD